MPTLKDRLYRFLRWSEKYTKTDMVYLASGGFWSVLGQIATALMVLGFAMLVARYLPKDVYGQYKYVIAVVALLSTFSLNGLGTAVFQSVASGFEGALQEGFWANIRWSAAVFLGALGVAAYYFIAGNNTLAIGILIGGSLSPFLTSANLANSFLAAKKDFRRSNLFFSVYENFFAVGALAITVLLTNNPLILVAVYFAGNTLTTLFLYQRVKRIYTPDADKRDGGTLSYSKHLSLMGILSGIAGNIDQILLFHFVGPAQLAIYNFAIAIPDQTKGPLKNLNTMVQAKFVNRSSVEIKAGIWSKMLILLLSTLIFIALYILIAPYLYSILFPKYAGAAFYSSIYILSLISAVVAPAGSYLIAKKRVQEQYILNVGGSLLQIILMAVGVIWAGLVGLVLARVATRLANTLLTFWLYWQATKTNPS